MLLPQETISSCISRRVRASSAPSGSSSSSRRGRWISARASATRCFCPPDSAAGHSCARLSSPTLANACRAASRQAPLAPARRYQSLFSTAAGADPETSSGCRPGSPPGASRQPAVRRRLVFQTCQQAQQGTFAAAAAAHHRHKLAAGNMQIQLVKNGVVAIAFRHPVQQQRDTRLRRAVFMR